MKCSIAIPLVIAGAACGSSRRPPQRVPHEGSTMAAAQPHSEAAVPDAGMTPDAIVDAPPAVSGLTVPSRPSAGCPKSYSAASGACDSTTSPSFCSFPEGNCSCSPPPTPPGERRCGGAAIDEPIHSSPHAGPSPSQSPWAWQCTPMFRGDGCPGDSPGDGMACFKPGKVCHYGDCCFEEYTCTKGKWKTTGGGCPP